MHQETAQASELGELEPGTRQRAQLRARIGDIAWTALLMVLAIWSVWSAVGVVRGTTAWAYAAVAWVLLVLITALRVTATRRTAPGR
ncbi:hypothetical protein GCM10010145_20530 [Streptomyces ruber]|uniref:Uncharacterized protein n=2 Tax=Streptomyces TaxID=1883 RepID=A0A918BA22_9ACTN|nr:hypothetical protein [Streptomyces ruber]GGQ51225.1 hypothetical protein GCM10010145_20530 [Streptomyces ruber]